MMILKNTMDAENREVTRVTFDLRPCVEKEKKVIDILFDIEGKSVFLRDALTTFVESDYFKAHRSNDYDGPGHHNRKLMR